MTLWASNAYICYMKNKPTKPKSPKKPEVKNSVINKSIIDDYLDIDSEDIYELLPPTAVIIDGRYLTRLTEEFEAFRFALVDYSKKKRESDLKTLANIGIFLKMLQENIPDTLSDDYNRLLKFIYKTLKDAAPKHVGSNTELEELTGEERIINLYKKNIDHANDMAEDFTMWDLIENNEIISPRYGE